MALVDITGQKFGRLTVIERDKEMESKRKDRHAMWKCQCDCGNIKSVVGKDLRSNRTQSCGCLQKEKTSQKNTKSLVGQKFGKLLVLKQVNKPVDKNKNLYSYWLCECECGNQTIVCSRELSSGDTKSCGCLHSYGEYLIEKSLKELNLNYSKQFTFKDLKSESNIVLRFDFALFDKFNNLKLLIEYDGPQHFETTAQSGGWNTLEHYKNKVQPNDQKKDAYCFNNNIKLLRISYLDKKNINKEFLTKKIGEQICIADIL